MYASLGQESAPLISRYGIPALTKDNRKDYEKKRAVYFILTSTLFERIAFYALMTSLFATLQLSEPFHWDPRHSQIALFIFSGNIHFLLSYISNMILILKKIGISYISTVIFAIISDAKVGTARTIIIGTFSLSLSKNFFL